ncbi:MAG: hypothetical protein BIFFINMI_04268 [Phycisphaerae bacterium]|nr:hypothetical protein [Phycisphaerae bacterium]
MTEAIRKVKPGDPLRIPAAAFNAFVDAAEDLRRRQHDQSAGVQPVGSQTVIVPIKNNSGGDLGRFAVLGIDGPIFTPADSEDGFKNRIALVGVAPADPTHLGRFAILTEPIANGKIGQAAVAGVCVAKVDVQAEDDGFADIGDGSTASLTCGPSGAATILWKESGTGEKWAIVRFGGGGGAGLLWGKAIDDWSSGNTVSMHPCDPDGGNEDAEKTITGYLISPTGGAPAAANVSAGDVLAYLPFGDGEGVILNADLGGLPPGTTANQLLRWDAGDEQWKLLDPPDAAYKVLQRASDGTLVWDYPKYT